MSEIEIRLWERAEAAIEKVASKPLGESTPSDRRRAIAKAATIAVLRELSDEVEQAEEDEVMWPGSWDLSEIADALEEAS